MPSVLSKKATLMAAIFLALTFIPIQTAIADNDPADTRYSSAMSAAYDDTLYVQLNNYNTLISDKASLSNRTSKPYKAWNLKLIKLVNQMKISSKKFASIPVSPAYTLSKALAVEADAARQKWLIQVLAYYQKPKVTSKDLALIDKGTTAANDVLVKWSNQYMKDYDLSNLAVPTSAPAISFNTFTDLTSGAKTMQATTMDTATFVQSRLYITEYIVEWYYKDQNSTPIPSKVAIQDLSQTAMFPLEGVTAGDTVFIRIAAKNAKGQGPWSPLFATKVL
ncbi:MAG: fibronectin type III domain-containing protein [Candidatus Nanopelagicus sp.]